MNGIGIKNAYRIGELAKRAGVTVRTVRYYEELGLITPEFRLDSGQRRYTDKELLYLQRIIQLKTYGLSLQEIIEIFHLAEEDPRGERRREWLIEKYQMKLEEARNKKEKLNAFIEELEWHIKQLKEVEDFKACPGEECRTCKYVSLCRLARNKQIFFPEETNTWE